jgi:tetratricopeptide (TPR) repeat protein
VPLPNRATATIGDIATWEWLGDALWASGDHGGAIGIYREAIDRQPSTAAPYRWLGSALTSLGRLVEAEEVYKEAQLRSDELAPWKWLAELYERHGREQEALDLLREAKARFPDNFTTWSWLADALRKRSSIEAKLLYGEAVKKLPQQRIPRKWKRGVTATDERD